MPNLHSRTDALFARRKTSTSIYLHLFNIWYYEFLRDRYRRFSDIRLKSLSVYGS